MPDPYIILLGLATALFLYVVFMKVKNGQPISTSLLYVPLLLGIAFLFYKLWADGQELAKLHSEVEKAKQREKDLAMRAGQAAVEAEKKALESELAQVENTVEALETKVAVEKERHEKAVVAVARVRTWDDFWAAMGAGSGDESPPDPPPSS